MKPDWQLHAIVNLKFTGEDRYYLIRTAPHTEMFNQRPLRRESGWRLGHRTAAATLEHYLARTNQTFEEATAD